MKDEDQKASTDLMIHVNNAIKIAQRPATVLSIGSLIAIILALSIGTFFCVDFYKRDFAYKKNTQHQIELLNTYWIIQNQQTVLLKVIDANMKDATIDTKVQLAKTIYDMAQLKQIPIHIICGLIETESHWKVNARSECGAEGLLQVMPIYGRAYLREKGISYRPDIWYDPIINTIVGVSMLRDFQDEHVERGRTDMNTWTLALHTYLWGPSNSDQLFGKTDRRVNVPNMAYPQRVIDASKKYKDRGL